MIGNAYVTTVRALFNNAPKLQHVHEKYDDPTTACTKSRFET